MLQHPPGVTHMNVLFSVKVGSVQDKGNGLEVGRYVVNNMDNGRGKTKPITGGLDDYVTLMLHMDEETLKDSSTFGHTITKNNNAKFDNTNNINVFPLPALVGGHSCPAEEGCHGNCCACECSVQGKNCGLSGVLGCLTCPNHMKLNGNAPAQCVLKTGSRQMVLGEYFSEYTSNSPCDSITIAATHADVQFGNQDWTVDFWWRPFKRYQDGRSSFDTPSALFSGVDDNTWFGLKHTGGATGTLAIQINPAWSSKIGSKNDYAFDTWYHLAVVRDGSTVTVYVNGVPDIISTGHTGVYETITGGCDLSIGDWSGNTHKWCSMCHIDEVRISIGIARWKEDFSPYSDAVIDYPYVSDADARGIAFAQIMTVVPTTPAPKHAILDQWTSDNIPVPTVSTAGAWPTPSPLSKAWSDRSYRITNLGHFSTTNFDYMVQETVSYRDKDSTITPKVRSRIVVISEQPLVNFEWKLKQPCPDEWKIVPEGLQTHAEGSGNGYVQYNLYGYQSHLPMKIYTMTHCAYVDVNPGTAITVPGLSSQKKIIFVQNLMLAAPTFVLSRNKAKYIDHEYSCDSVGGLWNYEKASVLNVKERAQVAKLLRQHKVNKAYIGVKYQWSGNPEYKWEDGSQSDYEPIRYGKNGIPATYWDTNSGPFNRKNQNVHKQAFHRRVTVTQKDENGWQDNSYGNDLLHMVCKKTYMQWQNLHQVKINLDSTKEAKEIWVEISSTSHPQATVSVTELQIMIQRYERTTSSMVQRSRNNRRDNNCYNTESYAEDLTPTDCLSMTLASTNPQNNKNRCSHDSRFHGWDLAGNPGTYSTDNAPRGCYFSSYHGCIGFNVAETALSQTNYYLYPICKSITQRILPRTYRPWMTSKIFPASQKRWENRWEMIKKFSDGSSVVGGSTQDADSQKVYNAVDLSIRARHQTDPISSAAVIFDGECLNGIELRMYEGTGDNQGSNEERRARCLQACIDKKTPLNTGNTWIGFVMQGYIVQTNSVKPGRCFCENVKSTETECRRQSMENDFKRYDYVEGAAVSQAIVMSNIGFGTIDMSYTLKRNRKGTCVMKFNQPLFPYNKGIQSQSNQLTKEACAEWCETALTTTVGCEYSNGVCSEMKGPITSQPLYYGTGKEAKYTIESGSDCSALGKAQITTPQECEIAANALSIQIGTMKDWTKTSVPGGCLLEVNAQDADFNANLQSRTQHSDRKLICKNAQPAKEGEWAGWACWMHENNDQKITMGMTTTKGSVCKASDMVDLIHTTDDGNKGASSECKTSGFLLEHTLKAKKEGGLYDQYSKTRLLSGTSLSHAKMTLGQNGKYTYTQSFSVYSGEDANLPDTGPYRVNIVRNGIDGALTIAVNGHTLLISNTPMYVGTSPLQVWFQGDGASQFTVENIQISNRMTNFVTYNTGQVLLDGLGPNAAQSQYKIKFSQLQMPSDARDHLLMIARSPPWRLIEAFQIEDIGCLGRHCNQCKSNQDCLVCEKGWYLHGTLCVANCPEGTRSIFVDQSTAMELNSLANLDKALLKTESVPIDIVQTGMNDIKCLPTHSGTPIMGQGQGGCLAFKMAEKDTYWTSNKPPPASCTHSETSPVANECMCGADTCAANKYCWRDNTCKENAKTPAPVGCHGNCKTCTGLGVQPVLECLTCPSHMKLVIVANNAGQCVPKRRLLGNPAAPRDDRWLGYHFNSTEKVVGYTVGIYTRDVDSGISYNKDVPGQWVFEGARDKNMLSNTETSTVPYSDRLLNDDGWVVLDDLHQYDAAMYTYKPFSYTQCGHDGWACPYYTNRHSTHGGGRYYQKQRVKTFAIPQTSVNAYHRYRIRFISSSTDNAPQWEAKIWRFQLLKKSPVLGANNILGRACLGMSDFDGRINRIRGTVLFDAANVKMVDKYAPPPKLYWGSSKLHILGSAEAPLRTFVGLPSNGLLRLTLPSVKRPALASHLVALNHDESWIGGVDIIDAGCNRISTLSNCAICSQAYHCMKCSNYTYLNNKRCTARCSNGRIPMDSGEIGRYCMGMNDNEPLFGTIQGSYVVPIGPCEKNTMYIGTCTSTVKECPLKKVAATVQECQLLCDQDVECVGMTFESLNQQCWLWGERKSTRETTTEAGHNYLSCPSTRQRQLLFDSSTITLLWENENVGKQQAATTDISWNLHVDKKCKTGKATKTLRGGAYNIGDGVICKYPPYKDKADDPWFSATITAINGNTVDVLYDDGDTATGIKRIYKSPDSPSNLGKADHRHNLLQDALDSYVVAEQFDYYDLPISAPLVESKDDCLHLCRKDRACDGIMYDGTNQICTVLHGCSETQDLVGTNTLLRTSKTTMVEWSTHSKKTCKDGTLINRGPIGIVTCRLLCSTLTNCQCYAVQSSDGTCFLSSASTANTQNNNALTAYTKGAVETGNYVAGSKDIGKNTFPIIPLTVEAKDMYFSHKFETNQCKDTTNMITDWKACQEANSGMMGQQVLSINSVVSNKNWPYGCIGIEGKGLYLNTEIPQPICQPLPDRNSVRTGIRKVIDDWVAGGTLKNAVVATYCAIEKWDTSQVTNLMEAFANKGSFNDDISKWVRGLFFLFLACDDVCVVCVVCVVCMSTHCLFRLTF